MAFYCHTGADECIDDSQCIDPEVPRPEKATCLDLSMPGPGPGNACTARTSDTGAAALTIAWNEVVIRGGQGVSIRRAGWNEPGPLSPGPQ